MHSGGLCKENISLEVKLMENHMAKTTDDMKTGCAEQFDCRDSEVGAFVNGFWGLHIRTLATRKL